ncbi:branched-chain-amino-acid aminotransferase, partial [Perkinsus olseni]
KVGSNYGPTLLPLREAVEQGYSQILWLLPTDASAEDYFVTEVGTMNLFVALRNSEGIEVVTPPLSDVILPGITRDSVRGTNEVNLPVFDPVTLSLDV